MKAILIPRLTRLAVALTTRKHAWRLCLPLSLLAWAGCATPGPTHVYLGGQSEDRIIDVLPGSPDAVVPTYLTSLNTLYGIAYDPFTDHLFLRVFPGDFIRVIDRPARKIKRSFFVEELPPGRGDLAIRSRDRHLFFAHPSEPSIIETTLHGKFVRSITLENLQGPVAGIAYDQKLDRLLILKGGDLAHIGTYDLQGKRLAGVALDHNVTLESLAYDSAAAEYYVPLSDHAGIGIFNAEGHLIRTLTSQDPHPQDFVDVGQRSLVRMF
jgi:hypothetical protein